MNKFWKRLLLALVILLVGITVAFVGWASTPLGPGQAALSALQSDSLVSVETINGWTVFRPTDNSSQTGFIFYPGGRVDYRSYAPILKSVAQKGFLVVLVPMPLSMAFFAPDKADPVFAAFPEIQHWALGGHSLGGAMAARYVYSHPDRDLALALWGSYPADSDSLADRDILALSVYGSEDGSVDKIEASNSLLPSITTWLRIEGGNHAQFGDYGLQPGDGKANINPQEQWELVSAATVSFLKSLKAE
ncbi:MAG TPA: alpha/beta hydrolase [Anaerolineaceae bacterium]|nr:alpha/beta hydrolase [Anaerolineaceae bacterium]